MREILFKAKRTDNGEWVEGLLARYSKSIGLANIVNEYDILVPVYADTVCQYTGLTDKNGNKIWENDILKGFEYPFLSDGNHNYYAEVAWFDNCPAFGLYTFKNPKSTVNGISEGNTEFMEGWESEMWEVIGNIFDNPELGGC